MELRAEMTAAAEERIIAVTSQKEANLNVQQVVDRHTRELKVSISARISMARYGVSSEDDFELLAN